MNNSSTAIKCRQCGYDLVGVLSDGVCFECGCSAAWSRTGFSLLNAPHHTVASLLAGVRTLFWASAALVAASLGRGAVYKWGWNRDLSLLDGAIEALQGVAVAGVIWGVFAVTRGDLYAPAEFTKLRATRTRWAARISMSILCAALLLVIFAPHSWRRNVDDVSLVVIGFVSLVGVWGLGRCLGLLASRAGADALGAKLRSASWLYIFVLPVAVVEFTTQLFSANINSLLRAIFGASAQPFGNLLPLILPFIYLLTLGLLASRLREFAKAIRAIARTSASPSSHSPMPTAAELSP